MNIQTTTWQNKKQARVTPRPVQFKGAISKQKNKEDLLSRYRTGLTILEVQVACITKPQARLTPRPEERRRKIIPMKFQSNHTQMDKLL